MSFPERVPEARPITPRIFDIRIEQPARALAIIDQEVNGIYLPFRGAPGFGTERAILPEPPHVPHRENNAEHTFNVADIADYLWLEREEIGLKFNVDFDPYTMHSYALHHDKMEIVARDVDAMTLDATLLNYKEKRERAAAAILMLRYPALRKGIEQWKEYEAKDTPEAQFVSDIDKLSPIRVICADGGRRWHDWNKVATSRSRMCGTVRAKLLTPFAHAVMDEIEADLEANPHYFPEVDGPYNQSLFE